MRQSHEGREPTQGGVGITRREALRSGALAGLGLVWATPAIDSVAMSAQLAQATSPVSNTTVSTDTTQPGGGTTQPSVSNSTVSTDTTQPGGGTTQPSTGNTTASTDTTRPGGSSTQPSKSGGGDDDEVLSDELPFTGFPLEQLLPLAGGAIATGAAAVRIARDRKDSATDETDEGSDLS